MEAIQAGAPSDPERVHIMPAIRTFAWAWRMFAQPDPTERGSKPSTDAEKQNQAQTEIEETLRTLDRSVISHGTQFCLEALKTGASRNTVRRKLAIALREAQGAWTQNTGQTALHIGNPKDQEILLDLAIAQYPLIDFAPAQRPS